MKISQMWVMIENIHFEVFKKLVTGILNITKY